MATKTLDRKISVTRAEVLRAIRTEKQLGGGRGFVGGYGAAKTMAGARNKPGCTVCAVAAVISTKISKSTNPRTLNHLLHETVEEACSIGNDIESAENNALVLVRQQRFWEALSTYFEALCEFGYPRMRRAEIKRNLSAFVRQHFPSVLTLELPSNFVVKKSGKITNMVLE